MTICPKCEAVYRMDAPDNCIFCKADLTIEKRIELKKEENKKDFYNWLRKNEEKIEQRKQDQIKAIQEIRKKAFDKLKCRICNSHELKVTEEFSRIYIKCNNCGNFDTRAYYNENTKRFGKLIKCDLCNATSSEINNQTGLPDWEFTSFTCIKNRTLCSKCSYEHYDELKEIDEEIFDKRRAIEYMFDDDELKYWKEGDEWNYDDTIVCDLENYGYNKAYKKALKEMKSKFPKNTTFVDIDE